MALNTGKHSLWLCILIRNIEGKCICSYSFAKFANIPQSKTVGTHTPSNLGALAAIKRAVTALEKGMGGGFLQTSAAQVLKKLVASRDDDADRQSVLAFLSGTQGYSPQSGQITGILYKSVLYL